MTAMVPKIVSKVTNTQPFEAALLRKESWDTNYKSMKKKPRNVAKTSFCNVAKTLQRCRPQILATSYPSNLFSKNHKINEQNQKTNQIIDLNFI